MTIQPSRLERSYPVALVLLSAGLLFYGLGWLPLIGPDEPRYAQVAREMYESGDWITPRLGRLHWFEKPALTYWLSATGYSLFGVSEFSARFGITLLAALGALLLWAFGGRVQSARYGYLSATVLLSSGIWLGFARAATFDMPLAVTMQMALLAFYLWDHQQSAAAAKKKDFWWYTCCFALGLAMLAKGLAGIVLPGGIIGLYLLLTRRLLLLLRHPLLLSRGAFIFLATTATWYAPMFARHGREFWQEFFVGHHFQRYLTNKYQHPQPFYFFFAIALMGCLPWSFYLIAAAREAISAWKNFSVLKEAAEPERRRIYLWLWALLPVVFFSLSGSKLPGYILPVFPPIALLIAGELEKLWRADNRQSGRWAAILNGLLLLLLGLVIGMRGGQELGLESATAWLMGATAMTVAGIYLLLSLAGKARLATRLLPFGVAVIVIIASHLIFSGIGRQESMRELSQLAAAAARPGERLIFQITTEQSLNFYAPALPLREPDARLLTLTHDQEIAELLKRENLPGLLVISLARWQAGLLSSELLLSEPIGRQSRASRDGQDDLVLLRVQRRSSD